jgi:hypothetical protein
MAEFKKPEPLKIKCTASDCERRRALGDTERHRQRDQRVDASGRAALHRGPSPRIHRATG